MAKADILMHPVRMRIIGLISRQAQTTQQLAKQMADVATPTLYHHLNLLVKAEILQVVKEEQKRGTYEKTYALVEGSSVLGTEDLSQMTADELMHMFQLFVSVLIGDYAQYLQQKKDRDYNDMGMRQALLHLSDQEFQQFLQELGTFFQPWLAYQPGPERRQRLFNTIVMSMPPSEQTQDEANKNSD
ncbi:transcriptional regulator [Dictyobacter alpinus]|uniref:Transcriptional regulator n=1 Tax=Dictyobacter alpinus TaxID=2014873 RepID=A0A402BJP0_9CHLR|nr:helix-turn-helix domain-containing protein [Dictyobacter alpinus]GCE31546.1 transcriptional regulator [Dictyobacter alpinus]